MITKKEIIVIVDKNGATTIEGVGFKGGFCEKVTAFLERALGSLVKRVIKKERWEKENNIVSHI